MEPSNLSHALRARIQLRQRFGEMAMEVDDRALEPRQAGDLPRAARRGVTARPTHRAR